MRTRVENHRVGEPGELGSFALCHGGLTPRKIREESDPNRAVIGFWLTGGGKTPIRGVLVRTCNHRKTEAKERCT